MVSHTMKRGHEKLSQNRGSLHQVDLELTNACVNPSLRQYYGYTVSLPASHNAHLPIVSDSTF